MSPEYQRTLGLYRFALTNYRDLQKDVSRGSGDYLTTFAFLLCGGDSRAGTLAVEESVRSGQSLASASTATPSFAHSIECSRAVPTCSVIDSTAANGPAHRPYDVAARLV